MMATKIFPLGYKPVPVRAAVRGWYLGFPLDVRQGLLCEGPLTYIPLLSCPCCKQEIQSKPC
jgi:hypothetical protein